MNPIGDFFTGFFSFVTAIFAGLVISIWLALGGGDCFSC